MQPASLILAHGAGSGRGAAKGVPLTTRRHLITPPAHSWMSSASPSGEDQEQSVDDPGDRGSAGRHATEGENLTAHLGMPITLAAPAPPTASPKV